MKQCPFCGAQIDDQSRFCVHCMHVLCQKTEILPPTTSKRNPLLAVLAVTLAVLITAGAFSFVLWPSSSPDPSSAPTIISVTTTTTATTTLLPPTLTTTTSADTKPTTTVTTTLPVTTTKPTTTTNPAATTTSTTTTTTTTTVTTTATSPVVSSPETIFSYSVYNGAAAIAVADTSVSGELILPSVINGYPVKSIRSHGFRDCTALTSIVIPDSVTEIGSYAFFGCTDLISIDLPDGVTAIGEQAFQYCNNLTKVEITDLVAWCNIDFGDRNANPLCYAKDLYLNGVLLTDLVIPQEVPSIKAFSFYRSSIASLTLSSGIRHIGTGAFEYCKQLTSVTAPNGLTEIGIYAFLGCNQLTSITIPSSVTSIGGSAFWNCNLLADVCYGGTEQDKEQISIGSGNSALINSTWHYHEHTYDNACDTDCNVCGGVRGTEHTFAPNQTECSSCGASGITYIVTGGKATITGVDSSISGDVTIPSTLGGCPVTAIGEYAFENCTELTAVTIPSSVTTIGGWAFQNCNNLTKVEITDLVAWCNIDFFTGNANPLCYAKDLYLNGVLITDLVIPQEVTSIKAFSFYGSSIASLTLSSGVRHIGTSAFEYCEQLTSVTAPNGVTEIGIYAFFGCSHLASIDLPKSLTTIGSSAFSNCILLTDVWYGGTEQDKSQIIINRYNDLLLNATWHYNQL